MASSPASSPLIAFLSLLLLLLLVAVPSSLSQPSLEQPAGGVRDDDLVPSRFLVADAPQSSGAGNLNTSKSAFILAANRTYRRDPLDGFKYYTGGWNISGKSHYWPSVGYTAAPLFAIAIVWFVVFALILLFSCCWYCCCRSQSYSYSRAAYAFSLILIILFAVAAVIGCGILYRGQEEFHGSTEKTLNFILSQANRTVDNLRKFSGSLDAAKSIGVQHISLPTDAKQKIDAVQKQIISSANLLASKTTGNSDDIHRFLRLVGSFLVILAAIMLGLTIFGFLLSILGLQCLVFFLIFLGWIMVTATFILSGGFLLSHNMVGDTCVAMKEWADHPQAHTALDSILPCYDVATANQASQEGKDVVFQLVNVVNQVLGNISNGNFPPPLAPLYFNQSGPLVPLLCNPYQSDRSNRTCAPGEVDFKKASDVWKGYICKTVYSSGSETCVTVGRLTPTIYSQVSAAANVSKGLYYYGPFLASLLDCSFVRETFTSIYRNNCPGLELYSKWIYAGLVTVSGAVMLSLIFWIIFARESWHRKCNKQFLSYSDQPHMPLPRKRMA